MTYSKFDLWSQAGSSESYIHLRKGEFTSLVALCAHVAPPHVRGATIRVTEIIQTQTRPNMDLNPLRTGGPGSGTVRRTNYEKAKTMASSADSSGALIIYKSLKHQRNKLDQRSEAHVHILPLIEKIKHTFRCYSSFVASNNEKLMTYSKFDLWSQAGSSES